MRIFADSAATVLDCWLADPGPPAERVAAPDWLGLLAAVPAGTGLPCWDRPAVPVRWVRALVTDRTPVSQYDLLRQIELPPGGTACLALAGDNFHGQHGRPWQALRGNLHLCLKTDLDLPAAACGRALVMLPAVAVMEVLRAVGVPSGRAGIKWVNDILLHGRKVAGVLTSARAVEGRLVSVVFGIGLNVAAVPALAPAPPFPGYGCLAEALDGPVPALGRLLDGFLAVTDRLLETLAVHGPEPILAAYRGASLVLGRRVEIIPDPQPASASSGEPGVRGRVLEILPDLSLRLEGVAEPVTSGRLALLPDPAGG